MDLDTSLLGRVLSYPTSCLHLEDVEFVDRVQTLKSIQIISNSNNNHNHKRHEDLSRGSVRHKGWPTSTLLRLATKAIESLATRSSSPTYRQGSGLEGSTSFTEGNTNFPVLNHSELGATR
jgi:predicted ribonuclease toxin of YeeF-YezG toxin-antitoxin module